MRRFLMHAEPRTRSTLPSPRVALCHPPPPLPPIPIYRTFNNAGIRKIPAHGTLRLEFLMKIFSLFLQSWPRLYGPRFFPSPLSITGIEVGRLWRNINRSLHERNNYRGGSCPLGKLAGARFSEDRTRERILNFFKMDYYYQEQSFQKITGKKQLVTRSFHSRNP